ncbi:hypothetical protein [Chthonobacter albigriseus]|uniref:hypothetical protein n=1 Tax=Chthonobacter albigriseus TaxID=1683161 RepID=UPI0015EEEE1D|nr:hypothetical protein [Chthonobacter albigriseus]
MVKPFRKPTTDRPLSTESLRADPRLIDNPAARHDFASDLSLMTQMRDHLRSGRPTSGNEALRMLRSAFPDVPLADRARVAGEMNSPQF